MVDFKISQTKMNVMNSFIKESLARNRYTFAAQEAKKQKMMVIESVFRFTAHQEKEHANIFYQFLKDCVGEQVTSNDQHPVDVSSNILQLLRSAQAIEYEENDFLYTSYGNVANREGFEPIAAAFHLIAGIEKSHGDRFRLFADLLEKNQLFVSDVEVQWICLNCGYIFAGKTAPSSCPVCHYDQGYFIRLELAPYTK